jgi:hypothetical protein
MLAITAEAQAGHFPLVHFEAHYNETTPNSIAARVERNIAPLRLKGLPSAEIDRLRQAMRVYLADFKLVFDVQYRKFFLWTSTLRSVTDSV